MPASSRGRNQVLVRHRGLAESQGDPADGQVSQRPFGRRETCQRLGASPGIPEQGGGHRAGLHPRAHLGQLGVCSPPAPTLPVEELARLGSPVQSCTGLTGGQRAGGRGEQQFGPLGRSAMDPVERTDRGIGLLHGVGS